MVVDAAVINRLNHSIRLYKLIDRLAPITNYPGVELMYTRIRVAILIDQIKVLIREKGKDRHG
jgi:hypothetical protein